MRKYLFTDSYSYSDDVAYYSVFWKIENKSQSSELFIDDAITTVIQEEISYLGNEYATYLQEIQTADDAE